MLPVAFHNLLFIYSGQVLSSCNTLSQNCISLKSDEEERMITKSMGTLIQSKNDSSCESNQNDEDSEGYDSEELSGS